ncbi:MAG: adaptor protein MecA [Candidatus Choladocola sp.]|nr:adaptor protein MecA [Candidatus Choladocola sp.]
MKIEKINDKQIRCTLTREDLANREIKLSELAYGSDKAKALFQDMMQVAAQDFGFDAENMPLVIEAIPVSMDSIILIITKVEDPEELDTRFARFSPEDPAREGAFSPSDFRDQIEGADDILGLIQKISEAKKRAAAKSEDNTKKQQAESVSEQEENDEELRSLTRFYLFHSLDDAIRVAGVLGTVYDGPNTLFKNPENGCFYLLLKKADSPAEQFNKVCNILSEYALSCKFTPGMDAHFEEHMEVILADHALQDLAKLN